MVDFEAASDFLHYDPGTGRLLWKDRSIDIYVKHYLTEKGVPNLEKWNERFAGGEAFSTVMKNGKKCGDFFGKRYRADAMVWLLHAKQWRDGPIFHINGDNGDSRIENLSRRRPDRNIIERMNFGLRPTDRVINHLDETWAERDGYPYKKLREELDRSSMRALARACDMIFSE